LILIDLVLVLVLVLALVLALARNRGNDPMLGETRANARIPGRRSSTNRDSHASLIDGRHPTPSELDRRYRLAIEYVERRQASPVSVQPDPMSFSHPFRPA
jgi:hypothetical protein